MEKFLRQFARNPFQVLARYSGYSAILMLHRVGMRNPGRIPSNQNMVIAPEELDAFIADCKKSGWSFILLDELVASIEKSLH